MSCGLVRACCLGFVCLVLVLLVVALGVVRVCVAFAWVLRGVAVVLHGFCMVLHGSCLGVTSVLLVDGWKRSDFDNPL